MVQVLGRRAALGLVLATIGCGAGDSAADPPDGSDAPGDTAGIVDSSTVIRATALRQTR